jgi:hypothetical protein
MKPVTANGRPTYRRISKCRRAHIGTATKWSDARMILSEDSVHQQAAALRRSYTSNRCDGMMPLIVDDKQPRNPFPRQQSDHGPCRHSI